ncbi:MAG: TldD/PmbA family protein, partial [candidate division WOR-3 bacterium]
MVNYLRAGLAEFQGEYADLRYEIDRIVQINVRGKEINYISDSTKDGFHLRCLVDGGLATQSFSDRRYLKKAIKQATRAARMAGRYVSSPIRFKAGPVVKERVLCRPREDPRKVSLNEKLKLLLHYNRLVLSLSKIQSTNFFYREWVRTKYFVNSLGSELEQEQVIAFISGEIIARDGNTIENVRVAVGGGDDFSRMRKREDQFEAKAKIAIDLLRAEPVAGGVYEVLLNPHMVGVFIHEAFGHFSEADLVYKNPGLLNKLQIGTTIGSEVLTVIDDPTLYGRPGYRTYDDEGTACKKVYLIKDGRLQGRLHSIETAFALNEEPNGHAIAVGWEYTPLVRMGNIYIAPGEMSFEEL